MAAGAFELIKYTTNLGIVTNIKTHVATEGLTISTLVNNGATGTLTPGAPLAKVSGSRKTDGIHARGVRVQFTTPPATGGYKLGTNIFLPVFVLATYNTYALGAVGTYNGGSVKITGKVDEKVK
jgi:hypothetical protein